MLVEVEKWVDWVICQNVPGWVHPEHLLSNFFFFWLQLARQI